MKKIPLLISGDKLNMQNNKIFKSIEDYPSKEILEQVLNDLYNSSVDNNVIRIRDILKEHVEGFEEAKNE